MIGRGGGGSVGVLLRYYLLSYLGWMWFLFSCGLGVFLHWFSFDWKIGSFLCQVYIQGFDTEV